MRTTVFVGTSLDGFLARPNGAFDFLVGGGGEADNGFEEFLATVDAMVMGRNTYEVVLPFPVWPYGATPVFVLSHRPLAATPSGGVVDRITGHPSDVLEALEAMGHRHVYLDGGMTVQQFLRAGLVDRIVMTRVPVLIGSGIPLFGPVERDVRLRHVVTRELSGGAVQSEYHVDR